MQQPTTQFNPTSVLESSSSSAGSNVGGGGGAGAVAGLLHDSSGSTSSVGLQSGSKVRLWGFHASVCGALTHLARNDLNATLIREGNGVYLLATLLPAPPIEQVRHDVHTGPPP